MKSTILLLVIVFFTEIISANSKPNFVWIISEDNSIHYLDHFFPDGADTPNIKNMATNGVTFDKLTCFGVLYFEKKKKLNPINKINVAANCNSF